MIINGRYKIVSMLGKGGYGEVYKIEDLYENNRVLALKKIRAKALNQSNIDTFKVEFKFLTSLNHPNLVKVYDFDVDRDKDELFFTMEYIQGASFYDTLGKKTSYDKIYDYIVQSCRALSYIHSKGIIHCDIKPDNMLIDENGVLKLMDFGFAGYKQDSRVRGTIQFMAPDFILKKKASRKVDLYSLGASLYYCLARKLPFKGKDKSEIIKNTLKGKFKPLNQARPNIPEPLVRLVHKAMAKDPENRFGNGDEIISFINGNTDYTYDSFSRSEVRSYFTPGRLFGEKKVFDQLQEIAFQLFGRFNYFENIPVLLLSREGTGKTTTLRDFKYFIQLKDSVDYFDASFVIRDEKPFQAFEVIIEEMVRLYKLPESETKDIDFLFTNSDEEDFHDPEYMINSQYIKQLQAKQIADFFVKISLKHNFVLELRNFEKANSGSLRIFKQITEYIRKHQELDINFMIISSIQLDDLSKYHKVFINKLKNDLRIIRLKNLGFSETSRYIKDLLSIKQFPEKLTEQIYKISKGNPASINEIFIHSFFKGDIKRELGRWKLSGKVLENMEINTETIVRENFSKISKLERVILKELLVLQRPVYKEIFDIVINLSGVTRERIQSGLDSLYAHKLIDKVKYSNGYHYYISKKSYLKIIRSYFTDHEYRDWNLLTGDYIKEVRGINQNTIYSLSDYYYRSKNLEKTSEVLRLAINKSFNDNDLELAVYNLKRLYKIEKDPKKKVNVLLASLNTLFTLGQYKSVLEGLSIFNNTSKNDIEITNQVDFNILKYNSAERLERTKELQESSSWLEKHKDSYRMPKEFKAKVQHWTGRYYRKKAKLNESFKYLKKAVSAYKSMKSFFSYAQASYDLCLTNIAIGNYTKALTLIFEIIEIFEDFNDKRNLLDCFITVGDIYYELWELESAKNYYRKANVVAGELDNVDADYKISLRLVKIALFELNLSDSLFTLETLSKISENISNLDIISDFNFINGLYALISGDIKNAITSLRKTSTHCFALRNNYHCFPVLLYLSFCYLLLEEKKTAFNILKWCEKKSGENKLKFAGYSNMLLAFYYLKEKNFNQAHKVLKKSLKYLDSKEPVINVYFFLLKTLILFDNGKYKAALSAANDLNEIKVNSPAIFAENKLIRIITDMIRQRVNCYNGMHEEGIRTLSLIIKDLTPLKSDILKGYVNFYLGLIYRDLDNRARMEMCLENAQDCFSKVSPKSEEFKITNRILMETADDGKKIQK